MRLKSAPSAPQRAHRCARRARGTRAAARMVRATKRIRQPGGGAYRSRQPTARNLEEVAAFASIGDGQQPVMRMPWNMPVEETEAVKVARAIRTVLGQHLRQCYSDVLRDPLPRDLVVLLQRLDDSSGPGIAPIAA